MPKQRTHIPKAISESVLKEYHHKCAICGRPNPQLHHLDENPSNNDSLNLLPLCPNCHLQDTHDPTSPPDPQKLKLFRKYKDPLILDPRFQPIFRRLLLIHDLEMRSQRINLYKYKVDELLHFVAEFQMGDFYRKRMLDLLNNPSIHYRLKLQSDLQNSDSPPIKEDGAFSNAACLYSFQQVEFLVVEMLRYQEWEPATNRPRTQTGAEF